MRLKIISDGTPKGTEVVNAETGEPLKDVSKVEWECDAKSLSWARVTFFRVPVELEAELKHGERGQNGEYEARTH